MATRLKTQGEDVLTLEDHEPDFVTVKFGDTEYQVPDFSKGGYERAIESKMLDAQAAYYALLEEGAPRMESHDALLTRYVGILIPEIPEEKAKRIDREKIGTLLRLIGYWSKVTTEAAESKDPPVPSEPTGATSTLDSSASTDADPTSS